jgi:hypothetical protein
MPRKKKSSELARRYQAVYEKLYDGLPLWKKDGIEKKDARLTNELARDVAELAEKEGEAEPVWDFKE